MTHPHVSTSWLSALVRFFLSNQIPVDLTCQVVVPREPRPRA